MLSPVEAFSRLGTETAFSVLARANRMAAAGRDIINLGIGQPDFPTPDHIVEAGIKAMRDGYHGYTPAAGIPALREAVAGDLLTRHNARVDPARVLITPGGKPAMFLAIMLAGMPGSEIIYPDPGFPIYRSLIDFTGARAVPVAPDPARGLAPDMDALIAAITPATKLVIINSPANPTGGVVSRADAQKLASALADRPDIAILSDEIYSTMVFDGQPHTSLLCFPEIADRVILLDGWSKRYAMTGWRLGFSVWPEALFAHVERMAINCWSCVNAPAQYAGLAALEGPQDTATHMARTFEERATALYKRLNRIEGINCARPAGAFYAFPDISGTGMSETRMQNRLLEDYGLALVAGTAFGSGGKGFLRLSCAAGLDDLLAGADRLEQMLTDI